MCVLHDCNWQIKEILPSLHEDLKTVRCPQVHGYSIKGERCGSFYLHNNSQHIPITDPQRTISHTIRTWVRFAHYIIRKAIPIPGNYIRYTSDQKSIRRQINWSRVPTKRDSKSLPSNYQAPKTTWNENSRKETNKNTIGRNINWRSVIAGSADIKFQTVLSQGKTAPTSNPIPEVNAATGNVWTFANPTAIHPSVRWALQIQVTDDLNYNLRFFLN